MKKLKHVALKVWAAITSDVSLVLLSMAILVFGLKICFVTARLKAQQEVADYPAEPVLLADYGVESNQADTKAGFVPAPERTISQDVTAKPAEVQFPKTNQPSMAIEGTIIDLDADGSSHPTNDLLPGHSYRLSIVVEATDLFADYDSTLRESVLKNVFFSVNLPRTIQKRDPASEYYLGAEIKLSAATDAEYTAAAPREDSDDDALVIDNVGRNDVPLYGTEQELIIEPLAYSAVEWSGLVCQDFCDWIADPALNSDHDFLMTHQIGDMLVGESRTFSVDFRVVDAETYQAEREAEPFTVKLIGAYPASEACPGPSVTKMKQTLRQTGQPIIEPPRSGESYYFTFALPFPTYLRDYLDASDVSGLDDQQTFQLDLSNRQLKLTHTLKSIDLLVDSAELTIDLPEGFSELDQNSLDITPVYWSTSKVDLPQAEYHFMTGIKSAYQPYFGNIINERFQADTGTYVRTSNSPLDFQLLDDIYESGVLYVTYRITHVDDGSGPKR